MITGVSSHSDKAGGAHSSPSGLLRLDLRFQGEPLPLLSLSLGAPPHVPHYFTHLHDQNMRGLNSPQEAMLAVVSLQDPEPHTHSYETLANGSIIRAWTSLEAPRTPSGKTDEEDIDSQTPSSKVSLFLPRSKKRFNFSHLRCQFCFALSSSDLCIGMSYPGMALPLWHLDFSPVKLLGCGLQNCQRINVCVLSHHVHDMLYSTHRTLHGSREVRPKDGCKRIHITCTQCMHTCACTEAHTALSLPPYPHFCYGTIGVFSLLMS